MKALHKNGITSVVLRVVIRNANTGARITGLTHASTGLIISTIADNESTATAYTAAGSTIETITTLGTFATPTTNKCRFKEVDATNHPGLYEIQVANARYGVSNARSMIVTVSGYSGMDPVDSEVQLGSVDLYDSVRAGLTALPNAAAEASGGLITRGTGTGQLSVSSGQVVLQDSSLTAAKIGTDAITAAKIADGAIDRATFAADTGLQTVRSNTAQSGGSTSITLDASASAVNDFYRDAWVTITGGTGSGQTRQITAYNGTSKAATVATWATNPDNTSTFAVLPVSSVSTTISDKTGYKLASDGLDSISTTAPSGVASNFREMLVQTWRHFFKKSTMSSTQIKTYADDGTTVVTTQTISDTGSLQTRGAAS